MKIQNIRLISFVFAFSLLFGNVIIFAVPKIPMAHAVTAKSASEAESVPSVETNVEAEPTEDHAEEDKGVIGLFGLNWKLFLAQLANFAIVLFVLWRWVFKPVVSGMEERTKKIEDSLNTADKVDKEKTEFEQWKTKEMASARQEATNIISDAKKTANTTKDQILEQAKAEQQQILEQSKLELEKQKLQTVAEAKSAIADLVIQSTEKLLRTKLDGKSDGKLIQTILTEAEGESSNGR